MLGIPDMRFDEVCWGINTQEQAATAVGSRRQQQLLLAASRICCVAGVSVNYLCVLGIFLRTSKFATAS